MFKKLYHYKMSYLGYIVNTQHFSRYIYKINILITISITLQPTIFRIFFFCHNLKMELNKLGIFIRILWLN